MDKEKLPIVVTEGEARIEVNGDFIKAIGLLMSGILHFKNAFYDVISKNVREEDKAMGIVDEALKICSNISIDEVKEWVRENYE